MLDIRNVTPDNNIPLLGTQGLSQALSMLSTINDLENRIKRLRKIISVMSEYLSDEDKLELWSDL